MAENIPQDLGKLICKLNPYINIAGKTGDIDIYVDNPSPPPTGAAAVDPRVPAIDLCQTEIEADDAYAAEWSFKGTGQRIARAVRIKYRYPKLDAAGAVACWLEDYLLVGYEGSGGG